MAAYHGDRTHWHWPLEFLAVAVDAFLQNSSENVDRVTFVVGLDRHLQMSYMVGLNFDHGKY